jgi:hypothetical protein
MNIKLFILIPILAIGNLALADGFISLEKAKTWMAKNKDKCAFAAVRTFRGKTKNDQSVLAMLGAKPNDVERLSNPRRTPALCIFDGVSGKGAAQESGCLMGYYLLDQDSYEPLRYSRNGASTKAKLAGKCDALAVKKLLIEYKFNDYISFGAYPIDTNVWVGFNDGFRGEMEADIHVLLDQFGVKPELDKAVAANLEKRKVEEASQKAKAIQEKAIEDAEAKADAAREMAAKKKLMDKKKTAVRDAKTAKSSGDADNSVDPSNLSPEDRARYLQLLAKAQADLEKKKGVLSEDVFSEKLTAIQREITKFQQFEKSDAR